MPDKEYDLLDYMNGKKMPAPNTGSGPRRTALNTGSTFGNPLFQTEGALLKTTADSQYGGLNQYTDPFSDSGAVREQDDRYKLIEDLADHQQSGWDKFGNGLVKFAGSFANGALGTLGTLYGIPASLIEADPSKLWDNPLNRLGNDISDAVSNNFRNYQSIGEQNASAWSPKYWATMNFFSDNILGNLGFAAEAYLTGAGVSKLLTKFAPLMAAEKLTEGMKIASQGADLIKDMSKAYSTIERWDAGRQMVSVGISAAGEASTEALTGYKDTKKKLVGIAAQQYGGESMIPDSVMQQIEEDSKTSGNVVYALNLPIIAGADMVQWGKSLSGFKSEFKAFSENAAKLNPLAEFATYELKGDAVKAGIAGALQRGGKATLGALKSNLSEAAQEGMQYLASEGTKNWYARKYDPKGWEATWDYMTPFTAALQTLLTTKEGVSNLLGGFAGGAPFGMTDYIKAFAGDPSAKKVDNDQLDMLNNVFASGTVKENLKLYLQNMARHASAEQDLQAALMNNDEHGARNAKTDQLKTYINSRIQSGRMDLLKDELTQLSKMGNEDFKSFFGLENDEDIDKEKVITRFQSQAEEMHDTYKMMDRLFTPDMYQLQSLPEEEREEKLKDLAEYKSMLWSYMVDYKDRDKRAKQLDGELTKTLGGLANIQEMMADKFKSAEINDLYRQYVAANVEAELNRKAYKDGIYDNSAEVRRADALKARIRARMEEAAGGNLGKMVSMEGFLDTGRQDFIDEYVFGINKNISNIINNPAVMENVAVEDMSSVIDKFHDLVSLHRERSMAVNTYNQLASAVKSGDFMGRTVANPDYDEQKHKDIPEFIRDGKTGEDVENPDYVPQRIPSSNLLQYDGYKKSNNVRKAFYQERRDAAVKNREDAFAFQDNLDRMTADDKTPESKDYHGLVSKFRNGGKGVPKGFKQMSSTELINARSLLNRMTDSANKRGYFDAATEKGREEFRTEEYIRLAAQNKALDEEVAKRRSKEEKLIDAEASKLMKFANRKGLTQKDLSEGFEMNGIQVDPLVLSRARQMMAEKEAAIAREESAKQDAVRAEAEASAIGGREAAPAPVASSITSEEETIIDDKVWGEFMEKGKLVDEAKGLLSFIADKIEQGDVLTDRERAVYEKYKISIDKKLDARNAALRIPIYRAVKGRAVQPEPSASAISDAPEAIKDARGGVEAQEPEVISFTGEGDGFIRLQRSDIRFDSDSKENQYDDEGNVISNQFGSISIFGDSRSPANLHARPPVRFRYIGDDFGGKRKEPAIIIETSPDGGINWTSTDYFVQGLYDLDGKEIELKQFDKDPVKDKERKEAYRKAIIDIQERAKKDGFVLADVRGTPSFGKLISNRTGNDGVRESKGLRDAFGAVPLNNMDDQFSVQLAVIYDANPKRLQAVVSDPSIQGNLLSLSDVPGIDVPQPLLNGIGRLRDGRPSGSRLEGQVIALLPTGKMNAEGTAQVRYPVMLSGSMLNKHVTNAYDIGVGANKGSEANMGEILIDALLNPYKEEHQALFNGLFEMAGLEYKGKDESSWNDFYTPENINNIVNKIFFASGVATDSGGKYSLPFKFEVVDRGGATGDATSKAIRIGLSDRMLSGDTKEIDVFVTGKDGKILSPKDAAAAENFVQFRIDDEIKYRKENKLGDRARVTYEEIQNTIKNKAFRTPADELTAKKQTAYTGFVFDVSGKMTTKQFPSYIDYADELDLIGSTVQAVKSSAGKPQYFINQRAYFMPKAAVAAAPVKLAAVTTKPDITEKAAGKQGASADTVILGRAAVTGSAPAKAGGVTFINKSSDKAQEGTAKKANTSGRLSGALRGASSLMRKKSGSHPMISLDTYFDTRQQGFGVSDSATSFQRNQIAREISSMMLDVLLDTKSKRAMSAVKLKSQLKDRIAQRLFEITRDQRSSMKDITYDEFIRLEEDNENYGYLTDEEIDQLEEKSPLIRDQYDSLGHAYEFFDTEEIKQRALAGDLDAAQLSLVTVGQREAGFDKDSGKPIMEPIFALGYGDLALSKITELNIVQAVNDVKTTIQLSEDGPGYEARNDDGWALRINPKSTLGMQTKILLNKIPNIAIGTDAAGNLLFIRADTTLGFPSYVRYDAAFEALLNLGLQGQRLDFEDNLMQNPVFNDAPIIAAVRMELSAVRDKNPVQYRQMMRQLAMTFTALKKNGAQKLTITQKEGFNPEIRTLSGARTNIGDQIAAKWEGGFMMKLAQHDYLLSTKEYDAGSDLVVTRFAVNNDMQFPSIDGKGNFSEMFNNEVERIFNNEASGNDGNLTLSGYHSLGRIVRDILGIELVEGDWNASIAEKDRGMKTAHALKNLNEKSGGKKQPGIFTFVRKEEVKGFKDLFTRVIGKNIANAVRLQVQNGKFNPESPFRDSTKAMDTLAKIFKQYHQSVTNSQAKNINNDNEYTNVLSEMFSSEVRSLQDPKNLLELSSLPIGKYHPFLSEQIRENPDTGKVEVAPTSSWQLMASDVISGIQMISRRRTSIIDARRAGAGDLDILSMLYYQGTERSIRSASNANRGMARYYMPFGDSTSANSLEHPKFAFDFDYSGGRLQIKDGYVRNALYSLFKSEVNRVRETFRIFDEVNNNPDLTLDQKKLKLDANHDYIEVDGVLRPGAGTRLYYWGKGRNEITDTVGGLYEIEEIDGKLYATGLNEDIYDASAEQFNDSALRSSFDSFIDSYMSDIINHKLQTFSQFEDALFDTKAKKTRDGKFTSPSFKQKVFGDNYTETVKNIFGRTSTIEGRKISDYAKESDTIFDTEQQAMENGYHKQLLKAMVIDHQVNHFLALTGMQQLTWDYAALDTKGTWKGFVDNMVKRYKAFASPFMATPSESKVNVITYNDVAYGQLRISRAEVEPLLTQRERDMLGFMQKSTRLAAFAGDMIPARYKEITAVFHAQAMKKASVEQTEQILVDLLASSITDGGTIITLQEYLFQMTEQGRIDADEYRELLDIYSNPNKDISSADLRRLKLKGQKMVAAGAYITGSRKVPVYMKDAKIVLIPAQVKGTQLEAIMNDLHRRQGTSYDPAPGMQLAPVSAMKTSNAKSISLWDDNGNIVPGSANNGTSIMDAEIMSMPRSIYGEQVQNPDKGKNESTMSAQLQKNMLLNIPDSRILGRNMFTTDAAAGSAQFLTQNSGSRSRRAARILPEQGITKLEAVSNMLQILREMREHKLQGFINRYGLDYSISEQWNKTFAASGIEDPAEFDRKLRDDLKSKDKAVRDNASYLQYVKNDLVIRTIQKMVHDIKQQAVSRKGMDISQLKALDAILSEGEGSQEYQQLKMPLTFTPGNRQYQQVVLSEIEKLFAGTKINGVGLIQASQNGHVAADESMMKPKVAGSSALKGYELTYDENGAVSGFTPPEIMIPWVFKDATGRPLDYSTYVNADGTVKEGMIDPDVLHLVGFRIPNTGLNMAGRFRVAKFLHPSYGDTILIPDILYSQMGTDLDFDKLYNYLYNIRLDDKGRILKEQGVINMRQVSAEDILSTPEARERAVHNILLAEDRNYNTRHMMLEKAMHQYRQLLREVDEEFGTEDQDDQIDALPVFSTIGKASRKELEKIKVQLVQEASADVEGPKARRIAELEAQYKTMLGQYEQLQQQLTARTDSFDMHEYLTSGKVSNAHLKAQSYQQLENAYMDIYHLFMSDMQSLPTMLTPLTSKMITDEVNDKRFGGRSYVDETEANLAPPNTEAGAVANAVKMRAGGAMVGGLANASFTAHLAQAGLLSLGDKLDPKAKVDPESLMNPIVFRDDEGKIIEESTNPAHFVSAESNSNKNIEGYQMVTMQLRMADGTQVQVPHKLYRIIDIDGRTMPIEQINSSLQGYLDLQKDPSVIYSNLNMATLNAGVVLNLLGYKRQLVPFMQQEVLKKYAAGYMQSKSPFLSDKESFQDTIIVDMLRKAGIDPSTYRDYRLAYPEDSEVPVALRSAIQEARRGDARLNGHKYFSVPELNAMIEQDLGQRPKDSAYYMNQLHILDMFYRADKAGMQLFSLQQKLNVDSKGFRDQSILGVREQKKDIASVADPYSAGNIIGSERLGPYNAARNRNNIDHPALVAYTYMNAATRFLIDTPERNNLFADFLPSFEFGRNMLSRITGRSSLAQQQRYNINIIQFMLSNPELYGDFTDVIPEGFRGTAADIRRFVFTDQVLVKGKGKDKVTEHIPSLARAIETISPQLVPGTDATYAELYPVLSYFKTKVQKNGAASWVYNFNTNQFRQTLGQEMPYNIVKMLEDENPAIQSIAKKMYLYFYLGSGITTPQSFGHLLAQEKLFTEGGFADRLNKSLSDLNRGAAALQQEVDEFPEGYNKPYWFRPFDAFYIQHNEEMSALMHGFFVQFIQNNPGDAIGRRSATANYTEGEMFEQAGVEDQFRLLDAGRIMTGPELFMNPPAFMDTERNIYVINRDYDTYTRYSRAGARMYTEYNFGEPSTPTLIEANAVRLADNAVSEMPPVDTTVIGGDNRAVVQEEPVVVESPVKADTPIGLQPMFAWMFDETRLSTANTPEVNKEVADMSALGMQLMPFLPAGVDVMPYSAEVAKRKFDTFNGKIKVNGEDAVGAYHPGVPHGTIEIAYEYAESLPNSNGRFLRAIALHEGAHAATSNIYKLMEQLKAGKIKKSDIADALGLKNSGEINRTTLVTQMAKAFDRINDIYDFATQNTALAKAYNDIMAGKGVSAKDASYKLRNVILADRDEMTAYLFNDKSFRDAMDRVQLGTRKKSLFGQIMDLLREMLGLTPGSIAHEALGNIFDLIEPARYGSVPVSGWTEAGVEGIIAKAREGMAYSTRMEDNIAKIDKMIEDGEVEEFCTI